MLQIGDIIDGRDLSVGAWFEAKIIKVTKPVKSELSEVKLDTNKDQSSEENNNEADSMEVDSQESKKEVKKLQLDKEDGFEYHVVFEG